MNQTTIHECLVDNVRDIYDAEKQLTRAIPKLAKAASSVDLAQALESHLHETQDHVSRLEEVFSALGVPAKGKSCRGMKGLIDEGAEVLAQHEEGELRDLSIIAAAQRVEHYEISAYGTARALAMQIELDRVANLLKQTLDEESAADSRLTECAMSLYGSMSLLKSEAAGARSGRSN
jgi:ferritin-like metal-binding protein YciE